MNEVIEKVRRADDLQLDEIIREIILRKAQLHPDWELCIYSLPRHGEARRKNVDALIGYLKEHC